MVSGQIGSPVPSSCSHWCACFSSSTGTATVNSDGEIWVDHRIEIIDGSSLVTSGDENPNTDKLGKLTVFGGVAEFPMRVKCATLSWHTMQHALEGNDDNATTE